VLACSATIRLQMFLFLNVQRLKYSSAAEFEGMSIADADA
jgi:hypothetical protein